MRRSELLGLRWKDVDLDMATVSVTQVMHRLKDGRVIYDEPKTAKGRRLIALTPTAALALKAHQERREADRALLEAPLTADDLAFAHLDGSPLVPDRITKVFGRLTCRLGLKVRFHDLRHTHASLMLQAGVHPKIVSERLGHAGVAITMDIYSHVLPGLQEEAADRFSKLLAGPPKE